MSGHLSVVVSDQSSEVSCDVTSGGHIAYRDVVYSYALLHLSSYPSVMHVASVSSPFYTPHPHSSLLIPTPPHCSPLDHPHSSTLFTPRSSPLLHIVHPRSSPLLTPHPTPPLRATIVWDGMCTR